MIGALARRRFEVRGNSLRQWPSGRRTECWATPRPRAEALGRSGLPGDPAPSTPPINSGGKSIPVGPGLVPTRDGMSRMCSATAAYPVALEGRGDRRWPSIAGAGGLDQGEPALVTCLPLYRGKVKINLLVMVFPGRVPPKTVYCGKSNLLTPATQGPLH